MAIATTFGFHISALDVAFISAAAAGFAALATPISTWLVTQSQRRSDTTERVYRDKLAEYDRLMTEFDRRYEALLECHDALKNSAEGVESMLATLGEYAARAQNRVPLRVSVIVPPSIRFSVLSLEEAWVNKLNLIAFEASGGLPTSEITMPISLKFQLDQVRAETETLRAAMRTDLGG